MQREKIRVYIQDNLILFGENVEFTDEDNIFERGFVNSLFAMKLLTYVEQEFSIVIENEDIEISNFNSVNAIVKLIERKYE